MDQDYLWSYHFAADSESLWFVPYWYNLLCRYNIASKKLELVQKLPQENTMEGIYLNLAKIENWIVMIPMYAKEVCIYDIDTKELDCLKVGIETGIGSRLYGYGVWKEHMYMFSTYDPVVVKLDLRCKRIDYIHIDNVYMTGRNNLFYFMQNTIDKNTIYFAVWKSNYLFKFDMNTEQYVFLEIGKKEDYYLSVCKASTGRLYLISQNGDLLVYDEYNETVIAAKSLISDSCMGDTFRECQNFIECIEYGDFIYFFTSSMVIEVNKYNYETGKAEFSDALMVKGRSKTREYEQPFFAVKKEANYIYAENRAERMFFQINMDTGMIRQFDFPLSSLPLNDMKTMFAQYKNIAQEGKALYLSLDNMLMHLEDKKDIGCTDEVIGKRIWYFLKDTMKEGIHRR